MEKSHELCFDMSAVREIPVEEVFPWRGKKGKTEATRNARASKGAARHTSDEVERPHGRSKRAPRKVVKPGKKRRT